MTNELYMYLDGVERIIRRMTAGESITKDELSRVKKTLDDLKLNSLEELRRSIFIQLRFLDDRDEMNKIAVPVLEDYDRMSEEIKRRTVDEVRTGIRRGDSVSAIRSTLQSVLGFKDWQAKRIAQDTTGAISQAKRIQQGTASGMNFRYTGPPAERQFCIEHLDKVYSLEQIEKMDNGQGLPVKYFGGGYNCRHMWVPVAELPVVETEDFTVTAAIPILSQMNPKNEKLRQHEIDTAKTLITAGFDVIFNKRSNIENEKSFDAFINGIPSELKDLTNETSNQRRRMRDNISDAVKQGARQLIVRVSKEDYDITKINEGIEHGFLWDEKENIESIVIIINDRIVRITRKEWKNGQRID